MSDDDKATGIETVKKSTGKPKVKKSTEGTTTPKSTEGTTTPKLGKKFSGEKFPTIVDGSVEIPLQIEVKKFGQAKNAITIEAYFIKRGHRGVVMQAAMKTRTKIRKATVEVFDEVFKGFF